MVSEDFILKGTITLAHTGSIYDLSVSLSKLKILQKEYHIFYHTYLAKIGNLGNLEKCGLYFSQNNIYIHLKPKVAMPKSLLGTIFETEKKSSWVSGCPLCTLEEHEAKS